MSLKVGRRWAAMGGLRLSQSLSPDRAVCDVALPGVHETGCKFRILGVYGLGLEWFMASDLGFRVRVRV